MEQKYSPVIKWSLIIGIVIVINLFFNYLISLVYESPKYENFCKQEQVIEPVKTQQACVERGGQWNGNLDEVPLNGDKAAIAPPSNSPAKGYCDLEFTCRKDFDEANKVYNRNVFVALVVLGIIMLGLSFALTFNTILSVSFSMGGILSIIIASIRYWSDADNILRVVILFLALVALIYFAIRKFKN